MAKKQTDKGSEDLEESASPSSEPEASEDDAAAPSSETASGDGASEDGLVLREAQSLVAGAEGDLAPEEDEGEFAAAQLGTDRYVMAAFFAAGILAAYIVGRMLHGAWSSLANKDWFSTTVPLLAAVSDEDKDMYSTVLGAVIALVLVFRAYRRPDIREWSDDVAGELAKVKWPTRKEVSNYTVIVIAASVIATTYLALLDRLWAFVTNLVYGGTT